MNRLENENRGVSDVLECPLCRRGDCCSINETLLSDSSDTLEQTRWETVSEPDAALRVMRYRLTDAEREELSINRRL